MGEPRIVWFEIDEEKRKRAKEIVGRFFGIYEERYEGNISAFWCNIVGDPEERFDELIRDLKKEDMIPILRYEGGEYIVYVAPKPVSRIKSRWINIGLLIATIITTTTAGALFVYGNANVGKEALDLIDAFTPNYILEGALYFAFPLLLILGIHELGHYYASRRHNITATLPYFIPVPPPPLTGFPLGTLGAFIATKDPITSKKSLLDIGAAGPICGLIVAIPVAIFGLYLNQINPIIAPPDTKGLIYLGEPLLFSAISYFFPRPENALMHPTAFAGWVGMLVTAMNLLPSGQLDGGHIIRALLGERQKYVSVAAVFGMIIAGFFFTGWLFLALLILLLGVQHLPPLNDVTPLDARRKIIGAVVIIIFILCFHPVPMWAA